MPVQEIKVYPNPVLKQVCKAVTNPPSIIKTIIDDLIDTLRISPGCVGIAAPQIGYLWRVIAIDAQAGKKPKNDSSYHGKLVCLNPQIETKSGSILFREGCLSIPEFTGNVIRAEKITVNYLDTNLNPQTIECHGFEAVIFQHEIDHLDGILFLDRVQSLKRDIFRRKIFLPPKK